MSGLIEQVRARRRLPSPAVARAIRVAAGVSQEAIAAELGVNRVTVTRWELGLTKPMPSHALRWAALLDQLSSEVAA